MSAKWRALQQRHRYTYSAVVFPSPFVESLSQSPLPLNPNSLPFFNELNHLISLSSIYSQVTHAKNLASSFTQLLSSSSINWDSVDTPLLKSASKFYLQVLFLENSLPLHRTLISSLCKINSKDKQSLIVVCFRELCEEYSNGEREGNQSKRFCLSRAALSVLGMPKLGYLADVIGDCAVFVAWDVVLGLEAVVSETMEWARPSPIVMEQCQEALSCSYYLLQRFPGKFKGDSDGFGGEELDVLGRILGVLLRILKSGAFTRDCFVAAGVSLCAALQVCLSSQELGLSIIEGIFNISTHKIHGKKGNGELKDAISKVPFKGDLLSEISGFSVLSRLCLFRGILTAVPRTVLISHFVVSNSILNGHNGNGVSVGPVKTILYDGILPELCNYCENPTDSHFNFHALTVMQICLQQMKTSMLSNVTDLSDNYDPIPEVMGSRILKVIWNNLEDPLSQTVKQVHHVFDLFLDIQSNLHLGDGSQRIKSYLQSIASDLLRLGPRCKGRYVPLAILTKRLGPNTILEMSPHLLFETAQAYVDDDVCCATTTFLKCFLECLRDECWNSNGVEKGYAVYRGYCLPPILNGLAARVSKLRSNLNTYALPVLLEVDVDSIFPMLAYISVGPSEEENGMPFPDLGVTNVEMGVEEKVAILISLLKVCRSLALLEGDIDLCDCTPISLKAENGLGIDSTNLHAVVNIKSIEFRIPVEWLALALSHNDELLRVDTAELLFLNPKTASLPSYLELTLLRKAIPLNMRSCSSGFQMKWTSLFRKFFSRVRTALERQFKLGTWQPFLIDHCNGSLSAKEAEETAARRAADLFDFMRWLSYFLFLSCYPSAPYKRKMMAMELILIMLNVWSITPPSQDKCGSIVPESYVSPYGGGITSPDSALLLVGSIIDSWDRLRENSFRILLYFPTPLPGISSEDMIVRVVVWAKNLVCSPRVRESDAGALTLKLIFRKYVLEQGWVVRASADVVCIQTQCGIVSKDSQLVGSKPPVLEYINSLIDWLSIAAEEGERNLSEACKSSFVHGVLLALRYTFDELDWNSDAVLSTISEFRLSLQRLLGLVLRITSIALWVVSADAWYLPDMEEMPDDDGFLMDEVDIGASPELEDNGSKQGQGSRPLEQIVMVGCWLAMKEVSLLLGTITRKIPLPSGSSCSNSLGADVSDGEYSSTETETSAILDLKQLEEIGNHFLEVLLKMKHNGAIDKTRAGFTALCNRLLCSNDPRLCKLTESWMEQLMERTVAKGQVVDDLLRRSAGIPAAFLALFLSEPEGSPKKLLPQALRFLIGVVNNSLLGLVDSKDVNTDSCKLDSENSFEIQAMESKSKIRHEGLVPTVHAFNVLRAAFNDTNLATDTSGFAAEALIASVRSFSSPYWEVRNSACLAYTALVRRMIGFLNVQKRESARRALSGLEFFHRYPALHPFFLKELEAATDMLMDASSGRTELNLAKAVHPSLCPMLILLSRLKPSTISSETGDDLDPFLLMPFVRRCSTQSNLQVRVLASKALVGLVSNEKLPTVLLNIASEMPCVDDQTTRPSFNSVHGMLLQLSCLLDSNCRNLADFMKKDKILGDLVQVLAARSWLASPKQCSCPIINASFLRVLSHMLSIARTDNLGKTFHAIRDLLLDLSTECLDVQDDTHYDPTIAELREQAAVSYFSCVLQVSKMDEEGLFQMPLVRVSPISKPANLPETNSFAGFQGRLIRSLSDSTYEVRLATLKWLLNFLKLSESLSEKHQVSSAEVQIILDWANPNLQATMLKLLDMEKHHRCMNYILRVLFFWNLLQLKKLDTEKNVDAGFVGTLDFDSMCKLWNKLTSLYQLTRHKKTQETLICCMAICVKRYASLLTGNFKDIAKCEKLDKQEKSDYLYECIVFFVNVIKEHSSPSEPANMRKAAAESIIASGLLEQAEFICDSVSNNQIPSEQPESCFEGKTSVNMYANQVLETWFLCVTLLEDEDDGVRQRLALNVQKCFSPKGSSGSQEVPTQVDKVIQLSFQHLSSIFGHWINYFDFLLQWVVRSANYVVPKGDLVRRVFDKEIDNHHEEKLLICQICVYYAEKLPVLAETKTKQNFRDYLCSWRKKFQNQLVLFAANQIEELGVDWISGVGNHKDAFLPVYANLLGFYTLTKCVTNSEIEDDTAVASDVVELGKAIKPFLRNPMISNLYLLLVKALGEMVNADAVELIRDISAWEGFDPYFLIR